MTVDDGGEVESPYKSLGGPVRIWNAFKYSMRGLLHALRVESAFRQELIAAAVLIVELINSSIEAAIDRISFDHHRLSGRAKDFGSPRRSRSARSYFKARITPQAIRAPPPPSGAG